MSSYGRSEHWRDPRFQPLVDECWRRAGQECDPNPSDAFEQAIGLVWDILQDLGALDTPAAGEKEQLQKSPITGHACWLGPRCDLWQRTDSVSITCSSYTAIGDSRE